jgi:YHYH protein
MEGMSHDHVHPHQPRQQDGQRHDHHGAVIDRRTALRSGALGIGALLLAAACGSRTSNPTHADSAADPSASAANGTAANDITEATPDSVSGTASVDVLAGFDAFADTVTAFTNGEVWMVECNGIPTHQMMVGITNWQQQVPIAQDYTGANAWQLPVTPRFAAEPVSARTGLFRGAIALAVNGIPIFNALNNRGDDAFLAGELDEFGGHCGRADDYHYHAAPLHLTQVVGPENPIAYALDGFAIYGSIEPDGSPLEPLDEYNGHTGPDGVYHYHGTTTYPYINGGLVGVVEVSDQVEPQPTTHAFRPAGEPLPGATITGFDDLENGSYHLEYTIEDAVGSIDYTVTETTVSFEFTSPTGDVTTETYSR